MILLHLLALLIPPSDGDFTNAPRPHMSDFLRLKCDTLPYRTTVVGNRCYFAVDKEVVYKEAVGLCSSIFHGSRIATDVPTMIFNRMFVEKSKFHVALDSSGTNFQSKGAKQLMCYHDSGYECENSEHQSTLIPGKCVMRLDTQKKYLDAAMYCSRQNMELATIGNDLENRMIRGALDKAPAWIRNQYHGETTRKWENPMGYSRFSTCEWVSKQRWPASQMQPVCHWRMSSVIDRYGYWGNDGQNALFDVICVKNAENDFTLGRKPCIPEHEWDDETGTCEWSGPRDACAQLIDNTDKKWFMPFPNFPRETYREYDLYKTGNKQDNNAIKVVVRRGCMFSGFAHSLGDLGNGQDINLVSNLNYGVHNVPSSHTGEITNWWFGLTRCLCFCDPTEATINDHFPAPPPRKRCIEHHVFNEKTQTCEWKHDPKYCAELITVDGRRQMVEIPNWPTNRKYDVHHWDNATKREENFHVTSIIVRQHCWATLLWGRIDEVMTLPTSGYGKYQVSSFHTSIFGAAHEGTRRVVCECIR